MEQNDYRRAVAPPVPGQPEPWLRGTHTDVPPLARASLHALELAAEDLERWCGPLTDGEINARPAGLPPVAFHLRHIARSIDRLLTYAEGNQLNDGQMAQLKSEADPGANAVALFDELHSAIANAARRIRAFDLAAMDEARQIGRKKMPTTVGGLLVHVADHTQRHVGQAITTAKVVTAIG